MERRVTGNCHARCEAGEKREITSNSYLSLYEVRSYVGWYRHVTLVLLACAFLVGICVQDSSHLPASEEQEQPSPSLPLIPLTSAEVRHLLARLMWPAPRQATLVRAWSSFRRYHQYWASFYHTKRRLKTG